ncbi:opsin, ultraviolet-sensitive [Halyomorpha halys]|uniref:opsin, ultraviolet-sensitive n=1 Tax=Halyomorpha halys TaxID=286706 RepID=UPI0034D2D5C5
MWPLQSAPPEHCFLLRVSSSSGLNISQLCTADFCLQLLAESALCQLSELEDDCVSNATVCALYPRWTNGSDPLVDRFLAQYPVADWPFFTKDFLRIINRHWLTFPPPGRNAHLIFMTIYLVLAMFGLPGNAIVIFMIARCRSLRTPSNLLVLNLAISDLILLSKIPLFVYNSYKQGPALGSFGCQTFGFVGGMTGTCSIMTLAAIALDRYYVIAYPLNRGYHTTRMRALVWIVLIWLYSAAFSVLPIAGVAGIKPYVPEGFLTSCSFDYLDESENNRLFIFGFFVAAWVMPFSIIIFSYIGICRAVLVVSLATRKGQEKEKRKKELRLAVVVIVVISLWFAAWTPYAIVALLGIFGQKHLITPLASMVPAIFCKSASCVDPFVYSLSHPRLKSELFRALCPKKYAMERAETHKTMWKMEGSRGSMSRRDYQTSFRNTHQEELIDLESIGEPMRKRSSSSSSQCQSRDVSVKSIDGMVI